MMRRHAQSLAAALLLLAGCSLAEPPEASLPLPPVPPARAQPVRLASPAARPAVPPTEARPAEPAAPGQEANAGATAEPAPAEAEPERWRVARDGTLGCAQPAPLRLARQGGGTLPRLVAEARVAGGCRTTFRVNEWELLAEEGDLVRLRLLNGPVLTLWFLREDIVLR